MTMIEERPSTTTAAPADQKVERLNTASVKRVIEPEDRFAWADMTKGQVIPDALLSVAGLPEVMARLTPEQKALLSREETAAMLSTGVMFEATLCAGFMWQIATGNSSDIGDPRVVYMLHEVGEETRHSRAFIRVVQELSPTAKNPLANPVFKAIEKRMLPVLLKNPALLATMILAGEEIPDLLQKLASEHPETDAVLASVNKYHRQEEARHLAFARLTVGELWQTASRREKARIKYMAPTMIDGLFDTFVHPGVYATVGLPTWKTWRAANQTPERKAVKYAAIRPIVKALLDGNVLKKGRIPKGWQQVAGVDANGVALPELPTLESVGLQ
ncbi:MAG TPA: diiron oxygenase [Acidimicrobiales bacterium]|nr:diiron oxygenase [Acidimicrobiales bacterium]